MSALPGAPAAELRSSRLGLALAIGLYALTRIFFFSAGIRFDATPRYGFWQILDLQLLQENLLESVLYLHSQPPLYNLFLGLGLKLAPDRPEGLFHAIHLALGLAFTACFYRLCERLGVRRQVGLAALALFLVTPPSILFENWLFYSWPIAVMLTASALFVHRFVSGGRFADASALFALLAALALTRSSFHALWLLVCTGFVLLARRDVWRRSLAAAALPLALVAAVYLKNQILFDSPATSSWLGMNVSRITTFAVPEEERLRLVEEGALSPLALIAPFQDLDAYPERYRAWEPTGVAALDRPQKSNGWVNLNHAGYLGLSRAYLADALQVLRHHTAHYLAAVRFAAVIFFSPPSASEFLNDNAAHIRPWVDFYYRAVFGFAFGIPVAPMLMMAGALFVCGWALVRPDAFARPARYAILFLGLNLLYVIAVSTFLELWENNRFRFATTAPVLILLGVMSRKPTTIGRSDPHGGADAGPGGDR